MAFGRQPQAKEPADPQHRLSQEELTPISDVGNELRQPASGLRTALRAPRALSHADVLQLQRAVGNRAVEQLLAAKALRHPDSSLQATDQLPSVIQQPLGAVQRELRAAHSPAHGSPLVIQRYKFTFQGSTLDTATYVPGAAPLAEIQIIDMLQHYLEAGFDDDGADLTATDKQEIRAFISKLRGNVPSNRAMYGYQNPSHTSAVGLDLLEPGAHTPFDATRWNDREAWLRSPSRNFITYSPNSRNQDPGFTQGHCNVVFGHDEGASEHWNRQGHTQTPADNRVWNQQPSTYHGLENRDKSNASGGSAPRYQKPSAARGSHPMYWDPNNPHFDPRYLK